MNEGFNQEIFKSKEKKIEDTQIVLEKEKALEVQEKDISLGWLSFRSKVLIDKENNLTFTEDIDQDITFMLDNHLKILLDAGILKKGNSDDCKSHYELAEGDRSGYVHLNKDDMNNAIKNGILKVKLDEYGDIEIL